MITGTTHTDTPTNDCWPCIVASGDYDEQEAVAPSPPWCVVCGSPTAGRSALLCERCRAEGGELARILAGVRAMERGRR